MGNSESQACWLNCLLFPVGTCLTCKGNGAAAMLDGFGNPIDMSNFNAKNGSVILNEITSAFDGTVKVEISNDGIKM